MNDRVLTNTEKLLTNLERKRVWHISQRVAEFAKNEIEGLQEELSKKGFDIECPKLKDLINHIASGAVGAASTLVDEAWKEYNNIRDLQRQTQNRRPFGKAGLQKISNNTRPPVTNRQNHDGYTQDDRQYGSKQDSRDSSLSPGRGDDANRYRQHQNPPSSAMDPQSYDNAPSHRDPYRRDTPPSHRDTYRRDTPPSHRDTYRDQQREVSSPQKDAFRPTRQNVSPRQDTYRSDRSPQRETGYFPKHNSAQSDPYDNNPGQDASHKQDTYGYDRSPRRERTPQREAAYSPKHNNPNSDPYENREYEHSRPQSEDPRYRESDRYNPNAYRPVYDDKKSPVKNHQDDMPPHPGAENDIWRHHFGNETERQKAIRSSYKDDYQAKDLDSYDQQHHNYGRKVNRELFSSGKDMHDRGRRPNEHEISETDPITHRDIHAQERENSVKPNNLSRQFDALHRKEWTAAYDEMHSKVGSERAIRHLLWVVTDCEAICKEVAKQQLKDLENTAFSVMSNPEITRYGPAYGPRNTVPTETKAMDSLNKYRKQSATLSIPFIKSECLTRIRATLLNTSTLPERYLREKPLSDYIEKCAELAWFMRVQDPPVVMVSIKKDEEGMPFDYNLFRPFSERKGDKYDYCVWPSLRIGEHGPILYRGYAQRIGK